MVTTDMDVPEFEEKSVELADGTVIKAFTYRWEIRIS